MLIAGMLPAFHSCMLRPVNTVQYNVSPHINTTTDPCQPRVQQLSETTPHLLSSLALYPSLGKMEGWLLIFPFSFQVILSVFLLMDFVQISFLCHPFFQPQQLWQPVKNELKSLNYKQIFRKYINTSTVKYLNCSYPLECRK